MQRRLAPRNSKRRLTLETLESRQLMAGLPLGALPQDTAEFLLGRVAVTPIFFESDGSRDANTENWTPEEIDQVLTKIKDGMQWWVDTLATKSTVHSLEFVFDEQYARSPVATSYEPISRTSDDHILYLGDFLSGVGLNSGNINDRMFAFNNAQRLRLGTDWAFSIVIADASSDSDGRFATTGSFSQAFAFPGGLYEVAPSVRPASTFAHETGHIFWAFDEYSGGDSFQSRRGYYSTQNANGVEGRTGFAQTTSIMANSVALAFATHVSPASTLALVGWQDSDSDGIFDVLDVPLEFTGYLRHDSIANQLIVKGEARAVPLLNRNPDGLRSDITLNRVDVLEVRLDGGSWQTLATPGQQVVTLNTSYDLPSPFSSLEVRFRDTKIGVTSEIGILSAGSTTSVGGGLSGIAFWDQNGDDLLGSSETGVAQTVIELQNSQGNAVIPAVSVDSAALPNGVIVGNTVPGVSLRQQSDFGSGFVGFDTTQIPNGTKSLWWFSASDGGWNELWRSGKTFVADFVQQHQSVSIEVLGAANDSAARLEAFDINGNLIGRSSTGPMTNGQKQILTVTTPGAVIASVQAFAVGTQGVRFDRLRTGPKASVASDQTGRFRIAGVADGNYRLRVVPPNSSYRPQEVLIPITVANGQVAVEVALDRFVSPWQNPTLPENVDNVRSVEPADALIVINSLNRFGTRQLGSADVAPPYLDVSGDGVVSPIDALRVINYLNRVGGQPSTTGTATAPPPEGGILARLASSEPKTPEIDLRPANYFELGAVDTAVHISEKVGRQITWESWVNWVIASENEFADDPIFSELSDNDGLQLKSGFVDLVLTDLFA